MLPRMTTSPTVLPSLGTSTSVFGRAWGCGAHGVDDADRVGHRECVALARGELGALREGELGPRRLSVVTGKWAVDLASLSGKLDGIVVEVVH